LRCFYLFSRRQPDYSEYYERLTSYTHWAGDPTVYVKALVEAGFVYSGERDTVFCFKCGATVSNWSEDDEPIVRHEAVNKNCIFLADRSRNVLGGVVATSSGNTNTFKSLAYYDKEAAIYDWIPGKGSIRRGNLPEDAATATEHETKEPPHRSENTAIPNLNKFVFLYFYYYFCFNILFLHIMFGTF